MLQMRVDLILTLSKRFFWLFSFLREKERNAPPRGFEEAKLREVFSEALSGLEEAKLATRQEQHTSGLGRAVGCAAAFAAVFLLLSFLNVFPELQQSPQSFPGSRKARNWLGMWRSLQSIYGTSSSSMACGARQAIAIAGSSMIRLRSKGSLQPHA